MDTFMLDNEKERSKDRKKEKEKVLAWVRVFTVTHTTQDSTGLTRVAMCVKVKVGSGERTR